jgi:CRISPR-associated protein Cas2
LLAQLSRDSAVNNVVIDPSYDNVLFYSFPPGTTAQRQEWGLPQAAPTDVL